MLKKIDFYRNFRKLTTTNDTYVLPNLSIPYFIKKVASIFVKQNISDLNNKQIFFEFKTLLQNDIFVLYNFYFQYLIK